MLFIEIKWLICIQSEKQYIFKDVYGVTFRLYSTKYDESNHPNPLWVGISFDKETRIASLESNKTYFFDPSLKTKVIAHGNGGGNLDRQLWNDYKKASELTGLHYNIIGIHWGSGGTERHANTGVKAAQVIKSFAETYSLDVSNVHGIGFRYS